MSKNRHTTRAAVYVFLIKDDKICMLRRQNTGWMDGYWGLPAGHLDPDEPIREAAVREAEEETGVKIDIKDLEFAHVMHRSEDGNYEYIDFFFFVRNWLGDPVNNEPKKADKIDWIDIHNLPEKTIPNVRAGVEAYLQEKHFSEFGWD